jgi:hypothetical protein
MSNTHDPNETEPNTLENLDMLLAEPMSAPARVKGEADPDDDEPDPLASLPAPPKLARVPAPVDVDPGHDVERRAQAQLDALVPANPPPRAPAPAEPAQLPIRVARVKVDPCGTWYVTKPEHLARRGTVIAAVAKVAAQWGLNWWRSADRKYNVFLVADPSCRELLARLVTVTPAEEAGDLLLGSFYLLDAQGRLAALNHYTEDGKLELVGHSPSGAFHALGARGIITGTFGRVRFTLTPVK